MHKGLIFFMFFVANEAYKIYFTKRKLIRYYYFINVSIIYQNNAFILMIFFFNFSIIKLYKYFIIFLIYNFLLFLIFIFEIGSSKDFYKSLFFKIIVIYKYNKAFFSFYNIFFDTQKAFHLVDF